ncbi:mycofactocin biosynthesis peptidyl-dipeptidase MftE [Nesterenkonia ebinurensis]|uniref:mycofactocin biosynthesis peptidyl-dipeptidase MftE n=1 Tax=Nesterenkonia ebinurensis TaxID=2608252 RepID=UPI00123D5999|nr:mycofactocin biosynthesis peptidyl-dipeptidase MftE [Nesterenkonia ebinurensis]
MTEPPSTEIRPPRPSALEHKTWPELTGRPVTVLLPLGSTEQHGPHLPLDTDTVIAAAVAQALAENLTNKKYDAAVAPPLPYGSSGEHQQFPGTISIGQAALETVLVEYGRSALEWASQLIIINGHGGNLDPVRKAVNTLRYEQRNVNWVACSTPEPDPCDTHAGHIETSLMLYLQPEHVRMSEAAHGNTEPLNALLPELRENGVIAVSSNGALGDPRNASAENGHVIFDQMVQAALNQLAETTRGAVGA